MFDWNAAEKHLSKCEECYKESGVQAYFIYRYVICPLRQRFSEGERSEKLWNEIMQTAA